jgi:hypothetical protein
MSTDSDRGSSGFANLHKFLVQVKLIIRKLRTKEMGRIRGRFKVILTGWG